MLQEFGQYSFYIVSMPLDVLFFRFMFKALDMDSHVVHVDH
jgi:hypothetical protein